MQRMKLPHLSPFLLLANARTAGEGGRKATSEGGKIETERRGKGKPTYLDFPRKSLSSELSCKVAVWEEGELAKGPMEEEGGGAKKWEEEEEGEIVQCAFLS